MGLLTALFAFSETPLGKALFAVIPDLAGKVIAIWTKAGKVTAEEIADYIEAQWLDPASLIHKGKP